MPAFRPDSFMILPTMACQAGCRYCFARKNGRVMDRKTAEAAMDFIARTAPDGKDFHVTFHGGEPLLAGEEFYAWILPRMADRFGRRVHLSVQSNLWAVTDSLAGLFRKYRVSVGTSLDGPEDMCDSQRGEGYYARTSAGIGILREHGIAAGTICTFASGNAGRAGEVYEKSARPYAVHGAVPSLGMPPDGMSLDAEQMKRVLLDSYAAYRADPAHGRITTIDAMAKGLFEERGCTCSFFDCLGAFAAVAPDGDVYSCQRFSGLPEYCLGNVRDGLTEPQILESPAYRRLRAAEDGKEAACGDCAHFACCRGGCLYNALAAGTPKDPYCEAYRAVFDRIGYDMALEMGEVMLGKETGTPVLSMAGDRPHPYDRRRNLERLILAADKGKSGEASAAARLTDPYPEESLNKLYLHVTFDCPLRCPHCYAEGGERKTEELSPERFAGIVREAADRRFRAVVVTGGEPLKYGGFDALCSALKGTDRKGTKLILRTSFGFPVPDERMERICGLFDEIVVSVDGDRRSHDARRGEGRYDRTVGNLEKAAELGAADRLGLAAVLSRAEIEGPEGEAVRKLAERLKIRKVRFRPVLPLGRGEGAEQEPWQICSEELLLPEDFHIRHSCGLGQNLYVEPDGTAYPCYAWCAPDKKLGDLGRESLGELLDRGGLYEYCRHDVDTNEKCRSCEVRYLCGGICKAWVKDRENVDSGDFDCSLRKAYFLELAERIRKGEEHGTVPEG